MENQLKMYIFGVIFILFCFEIFARVRVVYLNNFSRMYSWKISMGAVADSFY